MATLGYDTPAATWLEALPLGNGALGAMCWGDAGRPRFDLNDETAWSGSPQSERSQGGADAAEARVLLAEARRAIADGRPREAEPAVQGLQSAYTQAYLPLGSVTLTVPVPAPSGSIGRYRRSLDLSDAVHTVRSGVVSQRTVVSHVHGVLMHLIDGLPAGAEVGADLASPLAVIGGADGELLLRLPSDVAPGHETRYPPVSWSDEPGAALEGAVVARVVR